MSAHFLLELRSEEIPARMQAQARADLERLFRKELESAGLRPGAIPDAVKVWSTPRRLALIARDLPLATEAVREELKGPRTSAPPQALEGFLRKTGLSADQLTERDGVWFAVLERPGRATADVLAEAIPALIRAFPWPKSQRWGAASLSSESLRWVRPLSGIIALLGGEVVPCDIGGIVSGRETVGHRFHHQGTITIDGVDDYAAKLRAAHVIVDHAEREAIVRDGARRAASEAGLVLVDDEGLVIENAGLTEWPVPLLGRFDEAFLAVPPEVIQLTARVNQKYFICRDAAGKLANAFVCTANIAARDEGAAIITGNRKVLAARLSDARFFWDQDQKTPLAEQAKKLGRITFHDKLGSLAEKVARVADLAEWLAQEGLVPGADPAEARLAAQLCKTDLVTEMVGEFPELQGLMGGYYARVEGLPDAVADAIRDHYKPVGQGDDVPRAPVTVAVALADKLDTLRGFFAIDEKPTGSKDPFALRRAALGVIRLITDNGLRLAVAEGDLLAFFADRLKVQQREAGVRHDLIDAVFALGGEDDLVRLLARVHALQAFVGTEDGVNLLAGYKRAANILKKETWQPLPQTYTAEPDEALLGAALAEAAPKVEAGIASEDFTAAMAALASLRAPIDAFFETVTVNDADASKRANRLALLDLFRAAVHKVADFSRIEG
ncbi:glycine--tRNA ligase subunit beta [Novosphingobium sp. Fuku2-ISO-50]|uniref:glycine--tRNA ligase subunit beta n=1 Tax=Novosphingobium sp. Fuku2-ISO-50 TaxID=1739114 RepID=UPI001E5888F2|nr:glycine--tRNA ligase subunit beta [Novosphingobium sp. Fuku2-ISO-50]